MAEVIESDDEFDLELTRREMSFPSGDGGVEIYEVFQYINGTAHPVGNSEDKGSYESAKARYDGRLAQLRNEMK